MKVATAAQMRGIDGAAINDYGIPGAALMESAGAEVARKVEEILGGVLDKKICVFCGKGNNGGDGFVIARRLTNRGAKVKVILAAAQNEISGDALINLTVLLKANADIIELEDDRDFDKAKIAAAFSDCMVDALLGTGFRGEVRGRMAELVGIINEVNKPVVAVDIPSGIDADTGQVRGTAVKAAHTVAFALAKPGLLFQPGASCAGKLSVVDIGIPRELLQDINIRQNLITADYVRTILPKREPWAHKGTNGRVLLVAGSQGLTGAAALASGAAVRAGAGLVTLGVASSLNTIMEIKVTEVMTKPLPETAWGVVGTEAVPYIQKLAETCDVLAIGPGLGQDPETFQAVRDAVTTVHCPLVIDADAINALVGHADILPDSESLAILTPHPGELSRLTGIATAEINADRLTAARKAAVELESIVVLKGAGTVVAFPDGEVFINPTGNAGMATGGTGDVLTGVIAAFIAQGLSSHEAAVAGVYVHGLAGDIAGRRGMIGLAAGDVAQAIPAAITAIANQAQEVLSFVK